MSAQKPPAPPALVTLSPVQDPGDLQNIDTTDLPDGAGCYVLDTNTLYRLRKEATPASGLLVPQSGPGAWQPTLGDALFLTSVSPAAGVPGLIGANSNSTVLALAPGAPLHSSDVILAISRPPPASTWTGIALEAWLDTVTVPGQNLVAIDFINGTGSAITVPDGVTYQLIVWRPSPLH